MHFTYCPHCGGKLVQREIGDEGKIPFCLACNVPLWDMFTSSIICAVVNEQREIALLRQNYVSVSNYVCVAGIMKIGETAEETAVREIKEELGLDVQRLAYVHSYFYEEKELLMIGYEAFVKKADFRLSGEVDSAEWIPLERAGGLLKEGGIAWQLVQAVVKDGLRISRENIISCGSRHIEK